MVPRPVRPLDERAFSFPGRGPEDREPADDPAAAAARGPRQGVRARRVRARHLRALARRGRLRARRRRLDRGLVARAVRHHPAAAQRDRQPPPRPRPAHDRRGPDDPPRADARPPGAVPARPRPRQHRRPVRARRDPRQGGRDPRHASAASATSSGCTRSSRRRGPSSSPSSAASAARATGAACGSRWTRSRRGPCGSRSSASTATASPTATEALVNWCPGCRTSVSDLEVIPTPGDGHALERPLPPARRGDRAAGPGRARSPWPRPAPRRSSATPPSPCTRTTPATRPSSAAGCASRSSSATCRSSPTPVVDPAFGTGAVKITPAHDHDDHETGLRHGLAMPTILDDAARVANTGTRLRRPRPLRGPRADPRRPRGARRPRGRAAPRDGHRPLPAQRRRRRAAPQDAVVRAHRPARRGRARGHPRRRDRDPPGALREDLGALDDEHPGLERVPPAVVGPPDPGLVLPGRPRDRVAPRPTAPTAARSCGRPAAELDPGPGHLRHLVQLRPVAVLDARLAGRDRRPRAASTRAR